MGVSAATQRRYLANINVIYYSYAVKNGGNKEDNSETSTPWRQLYRLCQSTSVALQLTANTGSLSVYYFRISEQNLSEWGNAIRTTFSPIG